MRGIFWPPCSDVDSWIYTIDFAIAPETTREALIRDETDPTAPLDRVVEEASGLGVLGTGSLEYRAPVSEDVRLSVRLDANAIKYENDRFDDAQLTLRTGPILFGAGDDRSGLRAIATLHTLGGQTEDEGIGVEVFSQRTLARRYVAFARFTTLDIAARERGADRQTFAVDGSVTRYGSQGKFERASTLLFRSDADTASQSFWFGRLAAGAYRELPLAIGLFIEPSLSVQDFNGFEPVSRKARIDYSAALRVRASKRDVRLLGSAPFVDLTFRQTDSTVDRFDGGEIAATIGLTRTF